MKKKMMAMLMRLKDLFKRKPKLVTMTVNAGRADIVVVMLNGEIVQGFIKGSVDPDGSDLMELLEVFARQLENGRFAALDTVENNRKIFPTNQVKSVVIHRYDEMKQVTYEV